MLRQHSSRRQPGQVHRRAMSVPAVVIAGCAKPGKKKGKPRRRLSDETMARPKPADKTYIKKTKSDTHRRISGGHTRKEDVLHTKLKATQDYIPQEPG